MVSGVEVAGLVLGSLPLLISAAEHRDIGVTPLKTLFFSRSQQRKLAKVLNTQLILFKGACADMLSIAEIEDTANYMKQGANKTELRSLWAEQSLNTQLRSTFGDYFSTIEAYLENIQELIADLGKFIDSNIAIRFVLSIKQSKDVELLEAAVMDLHRVLKAATPGINAGLVSGTWRTEISLMKSIRKTLLEVYDCMDSSWSCQCKEEHTISFRPEAIQNKTLTIILAPSSARLGPKQGRIPWLLQSLEVARDNQQTPFTQPTTDLCASMGTKGLPANISCPSIPAKQYRIRIGASLPNPRSLIPLNAALKPPTGLQAQRAFFNNVDERIAFGARLALAVLQQHSTSWLQQNWTIQDVFLRTGPQCSPEPYFEASFVSAANTSTGKPVRYFYTRNMTLHKLGVALIELVMNDTIENLMNDEEKQMLHQPQGSELARTQTVFRLVDELPKQHRIPGAYCDAARFCLSGEFGVRVTGTELCHDDLFETAYKKIVKPLMAEASL